MVVQTSRLGVDIVKSVILAGLFAVPAKDKAAIERLTEDTSGTLCSQAPADFRVVATLVKNAGQLAAGAWMGAG
jgi:hypothetical protein